MLEVLSVSFSKLPQGTLLKVIQKKKIKPKVSQWEKNCYEKHKFGSICRSFSFTHLMIRATTSKLNAPNSRFKPHRPSKPRTTTTINSARSKRNALQRIRNFEKCHPPNICERENNSVKNRFHAESVVCLDGSRISFEIHLIMNIISAKILFKVL